MESMAPTDLTDDAIKTHSAYDSALENVADEWGFAANHADTRPPVPVERIAEWEAEAVSQARGQMDAGECGCCQV